MTGVTCEACRQALSARLDGEDDVAERAAADGHLTSCGQCRRWFDEAAAITRLARTALTATEGPGVPDTVLDAAPTPRRARMARTLRRILGGLGAGQFMLGVAQISALAGQTHVHSGQVASAGHLWHEAAAWNLAIGAGFAWIAARRDRPSAVVPILTVFVIVLSLLSVGDLITGGVTGVWLFSHGMVLAGYGIIVALTRPVFDFGDPPGGRGAGRRQGRWSLRFDHAADPRPAEPAHRGSLARLREGRGVAARRRGEGRGVAA